MKRTERKEKTHAEIVNVFFEELAKLNKSLITVNYTIQFKKVNNANDVTRLLEEHVLKQWIEIITYYDTYKYDLQEFETHYNNIDKAWGEFIQQTTPQMLGLKLRAFKDANQKLIAEIRKNY